jgi:hypothetical protein
MITSTLFGPTQGATRGDQWATRGKPTQGARKNKIGLSPIQSYEAVMERGKYLLGLKLLLYFELFSDNFSVVFS